MREGIVPWCKGNIVQPMREDGDMNNIQDGDKPHQTTWTLPQRAMLILPGDMMLI